VSIKIEIIDSLDGFYSLEKDWNNLYVLDSNAPIFLSWDWMITWWETYQKSIKSELFILCAYEKDQLIGVAPFHLLSTFPKSLIQGRTISFIGSGEHSRDKIVSQYSDIIVKPKFQSDVVKSIATFLLDNKQKWDFADFEFLLENSLVSKCFEEDGMSGVQMNIGQYGNRFYISQINDFEDFLNKMGNRWSKMYNKKSRKLDNQGKVEIIESNDIDSTQAAFQQLSKMHEARWEGRTEVNIFKSPLFNEFHQKIIERLAPKEKVFIKTLALNGQPLSSYYCFQDKSQIHYYQSGFYTENANKFSPLFLLVCKEIGKAIEKKSLFDFMFDENAQSYKKEQYAAQSDPMYRLMWSHKKNRMIKHNYAKKIQAKYLKLKDSLPTVRK